MYIESFCNLGISEGVRERYIVDTYKTVLSPCKVLCHPFYIISYMRGYSCSVRITGKLYFKEMIWSWPRFYDRLEKWLVGGWSHRCCLNANEYTELLTSIKYHDININQVNNLLLTLVH